MVGDSDRIAGKSKKRKGFSKPKSELPPNQISETEIAVSACGRMLPGPGRGCNSEWRFTGRVAVQQMAFITLVKITVLPGTAKLGPSYQANQSLSIFRKLSMLRAIIARA
jgi:hypothetical protein